MNIEFSPDASEVIRFSSQEAERLKNRIVLPEHVLLAIMRQEQSTLMAVLRSLGVNFSQLKEELEHFLKGLGMAGSGPQGSCTVSLETERILKLCVLEARRMRSGTVQTAHVLLSLLRDEDSMASTLLRRQGVSYETFSGALEKGLQTPTDAPAAKEDSSGEEEDDFNELLDEDDQDSQDESLLAGLSRHTRDSGGPETGKSQNGHKSATPVLDNFCVDLTRKAHDGKLDPVIGREDQILRVEQILNRKKKNNPVLIGEPGVGKSSIIEGLAQRISSGKVPALLRGKRLLMLDMTSVVSGTKYRGQFEERMKGIIRELEKSDDVILFIDELHVIMGAGNAQGSMDAANILKPALARGEIQCIGATTTDEYKKTIERDGALERRFQKVLVQPSTPQETLTILRSIRGVYEDHHHVRYTDEALEKCVSLAQRYMTDRQFPDKAIDAMDEAGARKRLESAPDAGKLDHDEQLLDQARQKQRMAQASSNYELASAMKNRVLELEKVLEEKRSQLDKQELEGPRPLVTQEDIAEVVSSITGVPVSKVSQSEGVMLSNMKDELLKRVIGQPDAVDKVTRSVIRSRAGLSEPGKPIATFLFLGPTGVGKTYLTKQLARVMFGSDDHLIRLDMSEYSEEINVTKLIGSAPGYVGYEEGGQLTERVRRNPYSIVLLDEIEKAHPRIYNLLLQMLDEGRLTDSFGRTVDFRNTVIIMTSNVGSRQLKEFSNGVGFQARGATDRKYADSVIRKALNRQFSPEFLNRIDEIVTFSSLSREDIGSIVRIETDRLLERLKAIGLSLSFSPEAMDLIASQGYDDQYGARPLRRALQSMVEDPLADLIVHSNMSSGMSLRAVPSGQDGGLEFVPAE